jgi:peptide deformylase
LATRFQKITVRYQDLQLRPHKQEFDGFTAQIIQHEIDHCNGKVI